MVEHIDQRILGALRVLDGVTGLPLNCPLVVKSPGVRMLRNSRGDIVVLDAPGFTAYRRTFLTLPADPPLESVELTFSLADPQGHYLPRQVMVKFPRDPDPASPNSLFTPWAVHMYPACTATPGINWGVIRATLREQDTNLRLPWGMVHIRKNPGSDVLASGQADWRGEALVAVPGIEANMPASGGGAVTTNQITFRALVAFDSPGVQKVSDGAIQQGEPDPNPVYLPNPDALDISAARSAKLLLHGAASSIASGSLAAGQVLILDVLVKLTE